MIMPIESRRIDVEQLERWAAMVGGGLVACYGLARRDRPGLMLAVMGGGIALRGYRGQVPVHEGMRLQRNGVSVGDPRAVRFEQTLNVQRPVEEIYRAWRRLENLPQLIEHLDSVLPLGGNRFHWTVRTAVGALEWDARLIEDRPNELVTWGSEPGSDIASAGAMRFESVGGGAGTELQVALTYRPPEGPLGEMLLALLGGGQGEPEEIARQGPSWGASPA